jgi:intein-encoded DNA endonuclease-like protein
VARKYKENNQGKAWIFKQRNINVLETKFKPLLEKINIEKLSQKEKLEYVAGFFDAQGGIPKNPENTPYLYIQFVQKNAETLKRIIKILEDSRIECGKLHEYGKKKKCWRFFIKANSRLKFIEMIKSRHPEKIIRLEKLKNRLLERQTR